MPTGKQVFDQTIYGSSGSGGGGGNTGTIMGSPAQIASKLHLRPKKRQNKRTNKRGKRK